MRLTAIRSAVAALLAAVAGSGIMAMLEAVSSPYTWNEGPIDFFPEIYGIVALVALPVCLAGILIAEQVLDRFDPGARLYKIHWALLAGGLAGAILCLPFVIYGGAEPALGAVFGSMSGLAYWLLSERRPARGAARNEG